MSKHLHCLFMKSNRFLLILSSCFSYKTKSNYLFEKLDPSDVVLFLLLQNDYLNSKLGRKLVKFS